MSKIPAERPGLTEVQIFDVHQVHAAVSRPAALAGVREAILALHAGRAVLPDQIEMVTPEGGELHIKGGYRTGSAWIAFKIATGNFPLAGNDGFTLVLEARTGRLAAIAADGGWLTDMRTAAAGTLATVTLARPDSSLVAVLGAGVQAREQITALRDAAPHLRFGIWSRKLERAQQLAESLGAEAYADAEELVGASDIVVTTTSARSPVLMGDWLSPGTHVTAVGTDMLGKRELDATTLQRADLIVCDDIALASRVGELQHHPNYTGRTVTLADVIAGSASGRTCNSEITVADLCGLGVEDVAMAEVVMDSLYKGKAGNQK